MKYILFAVFATAGVGLGTVNVWNNAMAINDGTFILNDLTAVVAGLAITAALVSLALAMISKRSTVLALLAVFVIAGCTATSLHYTITRVGGVADNGASESIAHNTRIDRAKARTSELRSLITPQMQTEARECRGYIEGRSNPKNWPKCLTARGMLQGYRDELATHTAALASLGAVRVVDPAAERISSAVGGVISPEQYRRVLPLITAGALELGVNLLLAIAGLFVAGSPGGSPLRKQPDVIEAHAVPLDPVVLALRQHGATSNRELARRLGWSEAKTSRSVRDLRRDGVLISQQAGRQKLISLVA